MSAEPVAPQNVAAEEAVLGAILAAGAGGPEPSAATLARITATGLAPDDFYYRERNGLIYEAALRVAARGEPTDALSVERELRAGRKLTAAGGADRLLELAALVPATANAGHWAGLVVEASERREAFSIGVALQTEALNGSLPADPALLDRLAQVLGRRRADAGRHRLRGLSNADVLKLDVPPTQEIVASVIEAGTVGTIASLPETFKSWLAAEITHKVAAGGLVLGRLKVMRQGPVGYWWQDDSVENEIRRIQTYASRHDYGAALPIRWHLNEGLRLPDDLPLVREEIEREQQVLVFLDSLYNFLPGFTLKDEEVAAVYAAIKEQVCDPTGASVGVVDHSPWPTEGNRGQRRAYGSVFKAAAIRWGIYLVIEAETLYVEARGNNLTGLHRTPVVFDSEPLELRLLEAPSQEVDLDARIDDFLRRNPGATTKVVQAGVEGNETAIRHRLDDSEHFVSVPPILFGKPRNAICWARTEDAPGLLNATSAENPADVGRTLPRETNDNLRPATSTYEVGEGRADVGLSSSAESGRTLTDDAAEEAAERRDRR